MEQNKNDFTQGSIFQKLLRFMLPILGAQILQAMYGAVDILVVGRFGTTAGLSGVSTGSNILNLVTFTVTSLAMGVTVLLGRYIGEKQNDRLGKVIGGAIYLFAIIGLALMAIMLIFADPLAVLMQAPEEARELTALYVRICGGGILFIVAYNVISSIFRGLGDSKMPLLFVGIACMVNVVGDLIFVAGFHWNVAGAALATVMAQAVSVVLSVIIIRKRSNYFTLTRKDIGNNREVKRFFFIGLPIAVQELLTQLSFLALCAFINRLGLDASAGYGVANKIVSFIMLIPGSLMQSMASFISQNVGAGLHRRAKRSLFTGMMIGVCVGFVVCLLAYFKGDLAASLFSSDPAVVLRAGQYLKGFAPEAIVTAIMFSFVGYFNGNAQTLFVLIQGLSQTFLVRLPVSYFMSIQPDASLTQIGYAAPLATIFGILLNVIYFILFTRKQKKAALSNNRFHGGSNGEEK